MNDAVRVTLSVMLGALIGHVRCSTDTQDLTAQRDRSRELGVAEQRIYLDHGPTGTNRRRSGPDQALAEVCAGDTPPSRTRPVRPLGPGRTSDR
ncbi:recombinase family protein [Nocardia brevicatena]|uniref:recombinase family protein n=1 Tax=Nocardia brevicatena TaxID=37327 RepID=UPI00278C1879|nr:recombinase family protein [Nocardia brevicatena]